MAYSRKNYNSVYGMDQGLITELPIPIIATRAPTTADQAPLGQIWINKTAHGAYILMGVTNNVAFWGAYASTGVNLVLTGALTVNTTATIGTGLTVTAGGITATGTIGLTGNILASTSIAAGTTLGAGTTIVAGTTVTGGTGVIATTGGVTATAGNITATAGDVVISTATKGITLPGPTRIINGAGVPANGLAINVGDIYINTTAATAITRVYIATAAGTWTYIAANA